MEKTCGLNAICQTENHVVQCSCPNSFTGNQDVECVRSKYLVRTQDVRNGKCTVLFYNLLNHFHHRLNDMIK